MKTERKTAALRRGIAFLCTLVLTLMAVTLPASAALTKDSLTDRNIGLKETGSYEGNKVRGYTQGKKEAVHSWEADGTTITGKVVPAATCLYHDLIHGDYKYYCSYTKASSTLTITNQSQKTCILSFSYMCSTNGATLYFTPASSTSNGVYTTTLEPNRAVTVKLTTASKTTEKDYYDEASNAYTAIATLSGITLKPLDENVSVTLVSASNGSYTAKAGSTWLEVGKTYSNPAKTEYTFTKGAAAPNYVFDGWYINDEFASGEPTFTTKFASTSSVEARFVPDPLLSVIQLGDGVTGVKTDYVAVNSDFYHSSSRSWHRATVPNKENGCKNVYFADPRWSLGSNSSITSSATGTAQGDWQKGAGRSQALANINSDIIRIQCKKSCTITFTSSMSATPASTAAFTDENLDNYGGFLYCYTSKNANETRHSEFIKGTAVVSGAKKDGATNSASVTVNKGDYLYLYAYGRTLDEAFYFVADGKYIESTYNYHASISNITVTPVDKEYTFTTANEDNTKVVLYDGTVTVNNESKPVSSGPYKDTLAGGTVLTLKSGTAPKGYTFIGWHDVTKDKYDYTNDTYTVTLTENYQVNPIYVPAMTITTDGTNGYENATYQYKALDGKMVPPNGQYVARGPIQNSGAPKFYTDLNTAFKEQSTVFLLAGDIINGNLTISTGKTLVIPDRFADPGPENDKPEQYDPTAGIRSYCKVTYSGNLTVNGKLVVNARQSGTASGRASGDIGYLSLSNGATVTVNSGGELCGYGLIRGGSITAKNGSTVRELMEISDRRSEQATKDIYTEKNGTFLFNHFSIKTIESRATYEYGSTLLAQYSITLAGNNKSVGSVRLFASSNALFTMAQGSITKYFDRATDKTVYHLDEGGKMTTGKFTIALNVVGVSADIDTSNYWVPLNAGFDLRTAGEMTMKSNFRFLPGASLSVEKGGKCIIDKNANLLFYRLNDYDTRSPDAKSPYYRGYSSKGYPYKATDLPVEGNYKYQHPTLATVGSARLNVDGEMIVNGGLYVSNDLIRDSNQGITDPVTVNGTAKPRKEINAADFTAPYPYANGYNVLTGTGTVTMNNVLSDSQVYEVMAAYGTVNIQWATVKTSPIKGLAADATADTQANYKSFDQKATYYGVYRPGGFYTWTTEKPVIAKIVGGGSETTYSSLADAVQAYNGEGYIQMLDKSTEPGFTVSKDVILDLNGKTVNLASPLTVAADYTLSGMDNSSKEYIAPSGKIVGTVTGTVAPTYQTPTETTPDGGTYDRYVAISGAENGTSTLSFHHFNISVSGYRFELAAPECALFFIGQFRGDKAAKDYLTSLGFTLTDIDGTTTKKVSCPMPGSLSDGTDGEKSTVITEGDAYLFEAYLKRNIDKGNDDTYTKKFSAIAQATFQNDGTQNSETKQWSFWDAWTDSDMDITPAEKEILDKFLKELGITEKTE